MKGTNTKIALIAGNAPSLASIDYQRLPSQASYDVFRCNQFYFEEEYYLGKEIKYAFANPPVLFEQSYTYKTLHYKQEYNIQNIVASTFNLSYMDSLYSAHKEIFSDIITGSCVLENIQEFFTSIRYNEIYHNERITSGVYMCAFAVALGYTELYLAGIDLYSGDAYAFDILKPNLTTLLPHFSLKPDDFHTAQTDIQALEFLAKTYNVKIYSICPSSPLSQHIPLAKPNLESNAKALKKSKAQDCIKDLLLPQENAYEKFHYPNHPLDFNNYASPLRNNNFYKFCRDVIKFPKQLARYYKGKIVSHRQKCAKIANTNNTNGGGQVASALNTIYT